MAGSISSHFITVVEWATKGAAAGIVAGAMGGAWRGCGKNVQGDRSAPIWQQGIGYSAVFHAVVGEGVGFCATGIAGGALSVVAVRRGQAPEALLNKMRQVACDRLRVLPKK